MDTWLIIVIVLLGVALIFGGVVLYLILRNRAGKAKSGKAEKTVVKAVEKEAEQPVAEMQTEVKKETAEVQPEIKSEVKQEQITPAVSDTEADEDGDDDEEEAEEQPERKLVVEGGEVKYIVIKYSKSFQAKLIQSNEVTKSYYSQLKNCLLSYKGVKSRMSWRWEAFRAGRKTLAKFRLRGKTLSVALALNPENYTDTKYVVDSLAEVAAYADTQCLYKIKNDRRVKYAKELIDKLMQDNGLAAGLIEENVDYASQYPYEETAPLIERKLIKELTDEDAQSGTVFKPSDVRQSVTAAEVDSIMKDEVAEILIEKADGVSDRTKVGIVNIDALSRAFADGETVTLEEVKKRVKGFDKKVTYLKVLARGSLDKKLTVKADAFSIQAVKMIILTGGKVIRK